MARRPLIKKTEKPSANSSLRHAVFLSVLLAAITLAVYFPVRHFEFINYDDPDYVSQNLMVQQGISWAGLRWALTESHAYNWHPVTWLSHMLDWQLFGPNAGAHHLVSVVIHLGNVLLLFLLFRKMTDALWPSAFVAVVFALHPLHVESVVWICERKDVLSTLFWLLTTWAYVGYVEKSRNRNSKFKFFYTLALGFFALGLMAKPMLVTLPLTLLLLDFWPLRRIFNSPLPAPASWKLDAGHWARLFWEKLPFFALALTSSIVTFLVQRREGAVADMQTFSLGLRINNAFISYLRYLGKTLWPTDLIIFYPYPETWPMGQVIGAATVLVIISAVVVWGARPCPFLFVGWFWFLGTLVPVIGIVQVGMQSLADRYMYVPMIGLSIMAAWGLIAAIKTTSYFRQTVLGILFSLMTVACLAVTHRQLQHWPNSVTVFEHAIDVLPDHVMAHVMAGNACNDRGETEKAIFYYTEALRRSPHFPEVYFNLGNLMIGQKRLDEAIRHYEKALHLRPEYVDAHANLAYVLSLQRRTEEALAHENAALQLKPDDPLLLRNISVDLLTLKRWTEAERYLRRAMQLQPNEAIHHKLLGDAFRAQNQREEAREEYLKALQLQPDFADAQQSLDAVSQP